jgi:hypothetical protein
MGEQRKGEWRSRITREFNNEPDVFSDTSEWRRDRGGSPEQAEPHRSSHLTKQDSFRDSDRREKDNRVSPVEVAESSTRTSLELLPRTLRTGGGGA